MFTWIYKNDLFKKKGICLERKSWNNFYFSAESTFQESVSKQNFYACAGAKKKVMLLQHSTCILSSVKLPSFKLNITLYFKCYLHHNCNINLNWNNTQFYGSAGHKILLTLKRCITLSLKFLDKVSIVLWLLCLRKHFSFIWRQYK